MSLIVLNIYKLCFLLQMYGIPILPAIINKIFIRLLFGCQIGNGAQIGRGVALGYGGLGIVIHKRAIIGNNVSIGTCVTIGGTTKKHRVPIIGNNCIIGSGAKILGPIKIGDNVVVGANAVVIDDVPDNSVVVGVPAKVIKQHINIRDYR